MIKRNFVDRSKQTILLLYKNLVRPHLEYCCQVWSPRYSKGIKLLEGVQHRATKLTMVWRMCTMRKDSDTCSPALYHDNARHIDNTIRQLHIATTTLGADEFGNM